MGDTLPLPKYCTKWAVLLHCGYDIVTAYMSMVNSCVCVNQEFEFSYGPKGWTLIFPELISTDPGKQTSTH